MSINGGDTYLQLAKQENTDWQCNCQLGFREYKRKQKFEYVSPSQNIYKQWLMQARLYCSTIFERNLRHKKSWEKHSSWQAKTRF
jgi:hypothetical protein